MGRRGPPKKPSNLRLVEGDRGHKRINKKEPMPMVGIPTCPAELDAVARREWKRVSKLLLQSGLVTQLDRAALAGYCASWSRWIKSEDQLKKIGKLIYEHPESGYIMQHPLLAVANTSMKQMRNFLGIFGMSPADRVNLVGLGDKKDELEEILNAKPKNR